MKLEPLWINDYLTIPSEFLSVSYTRNLTIRDEDGAVVHLDGVEAARRQASAVDLRIDVRNCPVFDEPAKQRILAAPELLADSRGVIRMHCSDFETRPKNLAAARQWAAMAIADAIMRPVEPQEPERRKKRGRAGLFKKS